MKSYLSILIHETQQTHNYPDFFDPSILPEGFSDDVALAKWLEGMKFQREMMELEKAKHVPKGEQIDWRCDEISFSMDGKDRCQVSDAYSVELET